MVRDGRWIIDDGPLQEIVKRLPKNIVEFQEIEGIGKVRKPNLNLLTPSRPEQTNTVQDLSTLFMIFAKNTQSSQRVKPLPLGALLPPQKAPMTIFNQPRSRDFRGTNQESSYS
jgi:hypothetical protein